MKTMTKNAGKKTKKIRICDVGEHKSYLINIDDIHKTNTMRDGVKIFRRPSMYGKNTWWGNLRYMKNNYMVNHQGRYIFEVTRGGFNKIFNLLKKNA